MNINIKEVQQLLAALGHSPGAIDGIWGCNSQRAMNEALKEAGVKSSFDTLVEATLPDVRPAQSVPEFWKTIRRFSRSEMRCQCGGKYCNGYTHEPEELLMRIADEIVLENGSALAHITSGLRCEKRNAETPRAAANSTHITGRAMDWYIDGMTSDVLLAKVRSKPGIAFAYKVNERVVHMNI